MVLAIMSTNPEESIIAKVNIVHQHETLLATNFESFIDKNEVCRCN